MVTVRGKVVPVGEADVESMRVDNSTSRKADAFITMCPLEAGAVLLRLSSSPTTIIC